MNDNEMYFRKNGKDRTKVGLKKWEAKKKKGGGACWCEWLSLGTWDSKLKKLAERSCEIFEP